MLLRKPLGIFIISWFLCLLVAGGHLYSPDEEIMFRVTESIATRARLDVEPIVGPDGKTFATRKGTNGREYAQYGVGNSLAGVPLYWVGMVATRFVSDESARQLLDFQTQLSAPDGPGRGYALLKRFFVSFTGSLIAAATATLIFLFCRGLSLGRRNHKPLYGDAACGLTAIAYIAGTMTLPHARTFFSEPLATFFLLLSFYLIAIPVGKMLTLTRAFAAGTALALALFTRLDTLFATPGLGLLLLWHLPTQGLVPIAASQQPIAALKQRISGPNAILVGSFAAPILFFLCWQLSMNLLHFGNPFSSAYADQPEGINFSTPVLAGLYGFLFSIGKSLFLFSPAILLGLLGWGRFCGPYRALGISLAVAIACKLLVHSTWQNWAGGWCWGPRHVFLIHPLLMIPAVAFISGPGLPRRIFVDIILLAGFVVQIYGSSQSFIDYYVLHFRTPYTQPEARVMYGGEDLAPSFITAEAIGPDGQKVPFPILAMPAPISDSIYVPQNSQWYRYAEMWNSGYTDNLWLRWIQRQRGKEQPVE